MVYQKFQVEQDTTRREIIATLTRQVEKSRAISCSKSFSDLFTWVSLCWFVVSCACACVLFLCSVWCAHIVSLVGFSLNDGGLMVVRRKQVAVRKGRMANTKKKGMALRYGIVVSV